MTANSTPWIVTLYSAITLQVKPSWTNWWQSLSHHITRTHLMICNYYQMHQHTKFSYCLDLFLRITPSFLISYVRSKSALKVKFQRIPWQSSKGKVLVFREIWSLGLCLNNSKTIVLPRWMAWESSELQLIQVHKVRDTVLRHLICLSSTTRTRSLTMTISRLMNKSYLLAWRLAKTKELQPQTKITTVIT